MARITKKIKKIPRPDNTLLRKMSHGTIGVFEQTPDGKSKKLVGYIVNYEFVPLSEFSIAPEPDKPFMVSFGLIVLLFSVGLAILLNLISCFSYTTGVQIFIVACLKVMYPNITEINVKQSYINSYLSVAFPKIPLSKNIVAKLYHDVGLNEGARKHFVQLLLTNLTSSDVIYMDGTCRQLNSYINPLSKKPYKKKYKGYSVINVITAFIPSENTLFSEVYPGSFSDTSLFQTFLVCNEIFKGLIVGDAAFLPSIVKALIKSDLRFSDLKYIGILRSNDKRIKGLSLLDFDGVIDSSKGKVLFKKIRDEENDCYYYAFKNLSMSHRQEDKLVDNFYLNSTDKKSFKVEYANDKDLFGVKVVESNLDLDVEDVYEIILERWIIETIFQKQKSHLDLNSTRVHDVFSVIGQEFINTIATTLYQKACEKIKSSGLIKNTTYKEIIEKLRTVWRKISDNERECVQEDTNWILNEGKPTTNDGTWVYATKKIFKILEILGLSNPDPNSDNKTSGKRSKSNESKKESKTKENKYSVKVKISEKISEYVKTIIQCICSIIDILEKNFSYAINPSDKTNKINESTDNDISDKKCVGRPKGSKNAKTLIRNTIIKSIYECVKKLLCALNYIENQISKFENLSKNKDKQDGIANENHKKFENQVRQEGLDPNSEEGKKRITQLKEQHKDTKLKEVTELEEQVIKEGLDPTSIDGKKRLHRLKRELKAKKEGKQLGKVGRPKSQETLDLEDKVRSEGLDPVTPEGKKRIGCLKRQLKTEKLKNRVREEGLDPDSPKGKKRVAELRREGSKSQGNQPGKVGRPKSQETLDLEEQVKKEGLDPSSLEGKKLLNRLKRERRASQEGKQIGKVGRPKSPITLILEKKVREKGFDPASTEGKKLLSSFRRQFKASHEENLREAL